jgi:hypothetical protein
MRESGRSNLVWPGSVRSAAEERERERMEAHLKLLTPLTLIQSANESDQKHSPERNCSLNIFFFLRIKHYTLLYKSYLVLLLLLQVKEVIQGIEDPTVVPS